jgi:hypothetical protein
LSLLAVERGTQAATNTKENIMKSNLTPALWRRITATALGAGAIAVGAMAMGAPTANALTFQENCIANPGSYGAGADRGEYSTHRYLNDRYEDCKLFDANGIHLGTYSVPNYNFFGKPAGPTQVSPPPLSRG